MSSNFISFVCEKCRTEIEATIDLIGQNAECPACGARLVIPDAPADITRHALGDDDPDTREAMKSRTIRIELGDF